MGRERVLVNLNESIGYIKEQAGSKKAYIYEQEFNNHYWYACYFRKIIKSIV